jgi:hypothetical protein
MEHRWNESDRRKPKYVLGEKPVPVPLCPPQIPRRLTREAAAGKRNIGSCCWFYDSEIPNYVFVKTPKHFAWPCSFNLITAKYTLV